MPKSGVPAEYWQLHGVWLLAVAQVVVTCVAVVVIIIASPLLPWPYAGDLFALSGTCLTKPHSDR